MDKEKAKAAPIKKVQTFGKKKNAVAVASVEEGHGIIRVNNRPLQLVEPAGLRDKLYEPILLLGGSRFANLNIRVKVSGGGQTAQIYTIRQAICKGIIAFNQRYVDEETKRTIKDVLLQYDRSLLVADPRRPEPKKFAGRGARARRQKSYR